MTDIVKVQSKSSVLLSTGVSLIKSGISELLAEIGKGIKDALTIAKAEAPIVEADTKSALAALEARIKTLEDIVIAKSIAELHGISIEPIANTEAPLAEVAPAVVA